MVILCAYNFEEFLLAQILFETCRNLVHMNGAYTKNSMIFMHKEEEGKEIIPLKMTTHLLLPLGPCLSKQLV